MKAVKLYRRKFDLRVRGRVSAASERPKEGQNFVRSTLREPSFKWLILSRSLLLAAEFADVGYILHDSNRKRDLSSAFSFTLDPNNGSNDTIVGTGRSNVITLIVSQKIIPIDISSIESTSLFKRLLR